MSEIPAPYVTLHRYGKPNASGVAPVYQRDFTAPPVIPLPADKRPPRPGPQAARPAAAQAVTRLRQDQITELMDASLIVLDLGDHLLGMLHRATQGKTAGLLAIHASTAWVAASNRLHRALEAVINAPGDQP